jgi:hypothetical protein
MLNYYYREAHDAPILRVGRGFWQYTLGDHAPNPSCFTASMVWLRVPGNDWDSSTPNFQEPFQARLGVLSKGGSQIISG